MKSLLGCLPTCEGTFISGYSSALILLWSMDSFSVSKEPSGRGSPKQQQRDKCLCMIFVHRGRTYARNEPTIKAGNWWSEQGMMK